MVGAGQRSPHLYSFMIFKEDVFIHIRISVAIENELLNTIQTWVGAF